MLANMTLRMTLHHDKKAVSFDLLAYHYQALSRAGLKSSAHSWSVIAQSATATAIKQHRHLLYIRNLPG